MLSYEGPRCYFWFVGFGAMSLGAHVFLSRRWNVELHGPFGFLRIGRNRNPPEMARGWVCLDNKNRW